ncbi:GerAB/ArcD/ProY family transporter [Peribacillus glennii]|uniref:Spore gernimation protein KB n=1 Tax=Peribacillus glennii TaxID=2303991 RepID=A0A372L7D4_9BACI|nr:GerAB/ArcD/ProY family transporter [Peribacillus glennii]RFU61138.1 spore gernimation protein KB [Peribacillus glennii]
MEKARISAYQLFVLMYLFQLGSAILIPLAIEAKQDAWLAILVGMIVGVVPFFIYYSLYQYYPDILPTQYTERIVGKMFGRAISLLYILYLSYLSARVLRDFGEMLLSFAYPETPLFIANALLMFVVMYTVRKGIEVLARTGELLFTLMILLAFSGLLLVVFSGLIDLNNLKPMLEEGLKPVIKVALTQTVFFPFGEVVAFAMIFPYLNHPKKVKVAGLLALGLGGTGLALAMAINISVLGVDLVSRSQFPLLSTIQSIQIASFLERLDVYFMIGSIIGIFLKISVYFYAAVTGTANLFNVKQPSQLAYPIGIIILFLSVTIASNFSEHLEEGLKLVPLILHLPFQIILPLFLLIIAFIKRGKGQKEKRVQRESAPRRGEA